MVTCMSASLTLADDGGADGSQDLGWSRLGGDDGDGGVHRRTRLEWEMGLRIDREDSRRERWRGRTSGRVKDEMCVRFECVCVCV